jgi:hypothetical protein
LKKAKRTPKAKKHSTKVRKKTRFALMEANLLNQLGFSPHNISTRSVRASPPTLGIGNVG